MLPTYVERITRKLLIGMPSSSHIRLAHPHMLRWGGEGEAAWERLAPVRNGFQQNEWAVCCTFSKAMRSSTMRVLAAMSCIVLTLTLMPNRSSSCGLISPSCFHTRLADQTPASKWAPIQDDPIGCPRWRPDQLLGQHTWTGQCR